MQLKTASGFLKVAKSILKRATLKYGHFAIFLRYKQHLDCFDISE